LLHLAHIRDAEEADRHAGRRPLPHHVGPAGVVGARLVAEDDVAAAAATAATLNALDVVGAVGGDLGGENAVQDQDAAVGDGVGRAPGVEHPADRAGSRCRENQQEDQDHRYPHRREEHVRRRCGDPGERDEPQEDSQRYQESQERDNGCPGVVAGQTAER